MRHKKVVILIVLAVFAVISLGYGLFSTSGGIKPVTTPQIVFAELDQSSRRITLPKSVKRRAKRTKFTSWKKHPFVPKFEAVSPVNLSLCGIIWHEKNPKAFINDSMVGVGDKIGDITIKEIRKDKVILTPPNGAPDIELNLKQ